MIKEKDTVTTALLGAIYVDSKDESVVRVNFDAVIRVLEENGFILPRMQFEDTLERALNKQLPDGLPTTAVGRWSIAVAIYNVAKIMTTTPEAIRDYQIKNRLSTDDLITDLSESEKEFFGSKATERKE